MSGQEITYQTTVQITIDKRYTENGAYRGSAGERMSFHEEFELGGHSFAEVAEILGKFQQVAERIRLEGHARFKDL